MDQDGPPIAHGPGAVLDVLEAAHNQRSPRLSDAEDLHCAIRVTPCPAKPTKKPIALNSHRHFSTIFDCSGRRTHALLRSITQLKIIQVNSLYFYDSFGTHTHVILHH